jgi:hypothetical protein
MLERQASYPRRLYSLDLFPCEKEDLLIASRSIRELLRVYERATGRQLSAILLSGGA